MELKNVDLAILNEIAIKIQTSASMGFDYTGLKINCNQVELRNIKLLLKNLGYEIVSAASILMIYFRFPQRGSYISTPIKILTAVDAYQLAEQNETNCQVLDDISNRLEKENKETLVYKANEINLNGGLLKFLAERKVKVYQDGDEVKVCLKDYFY
ncbi:hypothetical protein ING78_04390 [Ligilactobacillus salivarius]|uniref:hypothetical protein n=1 Tax=Ligilactobacillus salivarius TaxID=1624 RepID=UPI0018793443|nr:hypothetical protein [Ligilactobacillus salivarius]MBE7391563.1 hypothetical protein [Ligilactobacillus salivarius]